MDTSTLKQRAREFGADLVGVAPVGRLADAPPERNPLSIFPQAKSVIVVGRVVPRGALRAMAGKAPGRGGFRDFGFKQLEDNFLARTTYDLCLWIESQGFEAAPLFGYDVDEVQKSIVAVPVKPGKPAPNVHLDWKAAAAAAGLGTVGRHGLFITPEYGTRQRFALLLSDFAFEPDPEPAPEAERMGVFCDGCSACVDACPMGALGGGGERDNVKCLACPAGALQTEGMGRFNTVERIGAACSRACLAALEGRELLSRRFAKTFQEEAVI